MLPLQAATTLIEVGSEWNYLDDGSDQGTAWRDPGFDDAGWATGPAQLGYGDGDEATTVSYGSDPNNKYITTYFRHTFSVADPGAHVGLFLQILQDDGSVVYLNGTEVFRNNMPTGTIHHDTFAVTALGGSQETTFLEGSVDPAFLVSGDNLLAVEIHQANLTSSDISFDLRLTGTDGISVMRGPYLQQGTPDSIIVRWRTDVATDSRVRYGTDPNDLSGLASDAAQTTEHIVPITGLQANSLYYYEIGSAEGWFSGEPDDYFVTSPPVGPAQATRIWVIGDSGTADANAAAVRDAYLSVSAGQPADLWLMLGDNAYNSGTDAEYQAAVFNMYPTILRNTVLWPALGNHDTAGSSNPPEDLPYFEMFSLPQNAEAGGLASGTERYYSFDHANVHFICLDSMTSSRSASGTMANWLQNDLAATTQEWVLAFWHHPPYSKGSHNSDTETQLVEMRENILPILEAGGVDLVMAGHSHSYERSYLLDGHYGSSGTFVNSMKLDGGDGREDGNGAYEKPTEGLAPNEGAVYIVAGSSGKISGGSLNHPAMFISLNELGSLILDINDNQMDVSFINDTGSERDYFTLRKGATSPPAAPTGLTATAGNTQVTLNWTASSGAASYNVKRRTMEPDHTVVATTTGTTYTDTGLANGTTYHYVVSAVNSIGESADSNEASATPDTIQDSLATGEIAGAGTVDGSYVATHASDDLRQSITERSSGGKPSDRHSYLEHTWTFEVTSGTTVTLWVEAHGTQSSDNDDYVFAWSSDNQAFEDVLTVTKKADDNTPQGAALPPSLSGTVYVRVRDTDRTTSQNVLDTLSVDHLFIRTDTGTITDPPPAPKNLAATPGNTTVDLVWDAAPTASSYRVKRRMEGGSWAEIATTSDTAFQDTGLSNGMLYEYVVSAVNSAGESPDSNVASATPMAATAPAAPSDLTAAPGRKKKIELAWTQSITPGVTQNNIYRSLSSDGTFELIATINAATSYSNPGLDSGTTYYYRVTALSAEGESAASNTASATAP